MSSHRELEPPPHLAAGSNAEAQACAHLRAHGLHLVAKNFRCRGGEIDLIMRDGATLVFVEVRFRRSNRFGDPAATVDLRKQARLVTAAQTYLQKFRSASPCRFDVVAITAGRLDWIPDAFGT